MIRKLIVIGGIAAGLSAVAKAKRLLPDLEVSVYEKSNFASTGACGLPYFVGGNVKKARDLLSLSIEDLRDKRGISVLTGHEVLEIDHAKKTVHVIDHGNNRRFSDIYDDLVIATGAIPIRPSLPNISADGVFFIRTLEDAIALKNAIKNGAKKAVVIGCGFIGLETAEQLAEIGLKVTVVETQPTLLPFFENDYSEMIRQELLKHGVSVELNVTAEEILTIKGVAKGIRLSDGKILQADVILISIGVKPDTSLAKRSGIGQGLRGSILVNNDMRTNLPSIWACGDCVQSYSLITGQPCWVPSGTIANKQGRVAGSNIGGEPATFPGVLGSHVTKIFDLYATTTGLNLAMAQKAGFDAKSTSIVKSDKASYYPGGTDSYISLIFEKKGGRILGAQALGGISIAGRINVLIAAITVGMTVSQLNELDLLYSPSVAPVYDPLLIAAATALKQVVME